MEITHTKTESDSALPAYLSPSEMDWVIYKADELLPNGRLVSAGYDKRNIVYGFIKGSKRRKWSDGYNSGMDMPDYSFSFAESSRSIMISGSKDGIWTEQFNIVFGSLAERDKFIYGSLEVSVGSKPFDD